MLAAIDGNVVAQRASRRFGRAGDRNKGGTKQRHALQTRKHLRAAAEALEKPVPTWMSVRCWLEAEGYDGDAVEGTYIALVAAEIPEAEWLAELQAMNDDGELQDFMHSIYVKNMVALLTYDRKAPGTLETDPDSHQDGLVTPLGVRETTQAACESLAAVRVACSLCG